MSMHPRSLIANIVSGTLTAIIVIGLGYFIYEKQDSFSLFAPSGKIESDFAASPKPIASERIDEEQVENEMNRIAEEKRKVEEERKAEEARKKAEAEAKRKAEEARKKAEAEKKRLAELEAKKKAEAAEQKRLDEIALKKKQEEEKKKKDEEARQQKLAEEKKEKQKQEEIKKKEEKAIADKKAATDAANEAEKKRLMDQKAAADKQKAEEAKKAAAKAKADADAKAKAEAAENDRIADAYLGNASFVNAVQEAFYNNWSPPAGTEGYTVTAVIYVDAQGNIVRIDEKKSEQSASQVLNDSVKAAIMRTKKIKMPDNKHAVNKLVKEGMSITFDPKNYGF
jgi:DNA repair exonuclease SbcCD ATPase subunit